MADYHVGCGLSGIFAGTWKTNSKDKDCWHEWRNRSNVTNEAIHAVMLYLLPDNEDEAKSIMAKHNSGKFVRLTCEYVDEGDAKNNS